MLDELVAKIIFFARLSIEIFFVDPISCTICEYFFPNVKFDDLLTFDSELSGYSAQISEQICRDALYSNYVNRQKKDVEGLKKDEDRLIPKDFDYSARRGCLMN